jgi:hypothetical protein
VVHAQALGLMQRQQHSGQEDLVLLFEGKSKTVDDGTKNLEQFGNTVESLRFVGELEKNIVDGPSNKRSEVKEFSVDAVEGSLQEVPLAGILGIKQLKKLEDEAMVDVRLGDVGVEILTLDEAQEELINDLDMGPSNLENGLILFRVERLALGVYWGRDRAEQVLGKHVDNLGIHGFSNYLSIVGDVVQQLVQGKPLDFLRLHVAARIVKVENDVTLVNLLHKEFLSSIGRNFMETGQLLKFAMG